MAYTILSFCGGGIRGLISTGLLARLYSQNSGIVSNANMLAGTSTGADIIALIRAGFSPDTIYELYQTVAPNGFANPSSNPNAPAYNVADLASAQYKVQFAKHPFDANPPLSGIEPAIVITSFNVGSANVPWQPLLFNNLPNSPTAGTALIDAVVSSSAMPGMYGSWNGNVDGAFVNHDPTLAAIALAVSSGVALSDIAVICFGTGLMPNWVASDTSQWGANQWQNGDGNTSSQLPALLINGTQSPILNASMSGTSITLIPQLAALMLGGTQQTPLVSPRYAYVNPTIPIIAENDISSAAMQEMENAVATYDLSQATAVLQNNWPAAGSASA